MTRSSAYPTTGVVHSPHNMGGSSGMSDVTAVMQVRVAVGVPQRVGLRGLGCGSAGLGSLRAHKEGGGDGGHW
jgi:hypothetical protein